MWACLAFSAATAPLTAASFHSGRPPRCCCPTACCVDDAHAADVDNAALPRRAVLRMLGALSVGGIHDLAESAQYDRLASSYEVLDGSNVLTHIVGFDSLRASLLRQARGSVIELGAGTGVNISYYPSDGAVSSLTALDESSAMLAQALQTAHRDINTSFDVTTVLSDATNTPLPSHSFDTVVTTFCLCVVSDAAALAREMHRLVKHSGLVLVLDYTRSSFPLLAAYQDVTASAVRQMSKGCAPNLDLIPILRAAGLEVESKSSTLGGLVLALQLRPVQ